MKLAPEIRVAAAHCLREAREEFREMAMTDHLINNRGLMYQYGAQLAEHYAWRADHMDNMRGWCATAAYLLDRARAANRRYLQ